MKLRSVSVTGLFGMFDHTVDVMSEGLTFIHSPNGYGKSTFVRMIFQILKGDINELREIPFARMDLTFDDETNIIVEKNEDDLFIQSQRHGIVSEMTDDDMRSVMEVTYIPSERLIVKKMDGRLVPALESYISEFSDRVQNAQDDNELNIKHIESEDMRNDELVFWSKDLKAKLDFIREAGFTTEIPSGLRFPPSRHDVNQSAQEYLDLAYAISEYIERNYYLAESIVVFKDIINGLLLSKNLTINENGMAGVEFDDGTSLPLNKLSSGEKQIMVMFYKIIFQANPGSLVIIDEPEISLHISWQQQMGSIFMDLARLRHLQIIVATHSPQIVHDKWDLANELRAERA